MKTSSFIFDTAPINRHCSTNSHSLQSTQSMTQHPAMHLTHLKVLETLEYRCRQTIHRTTIQVIWCARNSASWVLGVFKNRSTSVMLQLYTSLVRCRVEYCCPLWNPLKVENIQKVEDIQEFYSQIRLTSNPKLLSEIIQAKTPLTTATKGKIHDHSCMKDLKPKCSK